MKTQTILSGLAAVILLLIPVSAAPPTVISFGCIANNGCTGGSLEAYNSSAMTAGNIISVAGFYAGGDGGSGNFVVLGQQPAVCNVYTSTASNTSGSPGTTTIIFTGSPSYPTGLTVGELVSGLGVPGFDVRVQPGSEIAGITMSGSPQHISAISLTLPLTGTATGTPNINLTITGSNGGTLITDSYSASPVFANCYQKTNYHGDPHEWGAYGDATPDGTIGHDDTIALQNWLGAYGNAVNVNSTLPSGTPPANFGPWNATIPANYLVTSPLFCPPNATIRGDENLTNNNSNGQNFNPRVNFIASSATLTPFSGYTFPSANPVTSSSFYGSQAVFGTYAYCRLSGIGVSGNGFVAKTTGNTNATTTINNLGSTFNVHIGNAVVGSVLNDIPPGTVVVAVNSSCLSACTITVSQPTNLSSSTETIYFYGPDAVDVLDNRLTVDGFSLLANGRYDLFCGFQKGPNIDGISVKDTSFQDALLDDFYAPGACSNVRLIGNIVAGAGTNDPYTDGGGIGIYFASDEMNLSGGVIEESKAAGVYLAKAFSVSMTGMDI